MHTRSCLPTVDIVDDDSDVLGSLCFLLETEGFRVRTFASGSDILAQAPAISSDCLVIDYKMGGMNGLDLVRHLQARGSTIPVVLITGYPDESIPARAASVGVRHVVLKPHVEDSLVMHIRSAMAEASSSKPSHHG